jgi:hypothetical protein
MILKCLARPLLLVLIAVTAVVAPPAVAAATPCKAVTTTVSGTVEPNGDNSAPFAAGWLKGTLIARFTITGTVGEAFTIESTGTIVTKHGSINVDTVGTLSFSSATSVTFAADGPVTGGDDKYAHATGFLTFSGNADLAAGTFTEAIDGEICR